MFTAHTGHVPVHEKINSLCIKRAIIEKAEDQRVGRLEQKKKNQNSALQVTVLKFFMEVSIAKRPFEHILWPQVFNSR